VSYTRETQADQDWQRGNKFSLFGYLKYICFKAVYLALVGKPRTTEEAMLVAGWPEAPRQRQRRAERS
jgi:hypothetical protein